MLRRLEAAEHAEQEKRRYKGGRAGVMLENLLDEGSLKVSPRKGSGGDKVDIMCESRV